MDKVLVLGGAGFIGYHLLERLVREGGHQITVVDNLSRGQMDADLTNVLESNPQIKLITADLTDPLSFRQLNGPFDHVYLFAGIVGVRNVVSNPTRVVNSNTKIVINTLDWIDQVGCGRLFYASTSEAYGGMVDLDVVPVPTPENVPLGVVDILNPRSTYALTKMLGEAAVIHQSASSGFAAVIVRYHNIYGPRMGFDHVIPEIFQRLFDHVDPMPVYGMEQTRAFCYVSDAVEATLRLMNNTLPGCEIVHLGNDREETTIRNLFDKMLAVTGANPVVQELDAPVGAVNRRCPDTGKLRKLTGFEPAVGLDLGLELTWRWYQGWLEQAQQTAKLKR